MVHIYMAKDPASLDVFLSLVKSRICRLCRKVAGGKNVERPACRINERRPCLQNHGNGVVYHFRNVYLCMLLQKRARLSILRITFAFL